VLPINKMNAFEESGMSKSGIRRNKPLGRLLSTERVVDTAPNVLRSRLSSIQRLSSF
jgi:hypothetical protein